MKKLADLKQPVSSYTLIIRMLYEISTHASVCSMQDGVITGDYTDILDHCDNIHITEPETVDKYKQVADLIHDIIASEPWYDEQTCSPSVILSCVGRLYNNRFAISNYDNTELAIGLYPLAYLVNHRCMPNATFVFDGTRMYLRSITAIHKNEEITISYVDSTKPSYVRNQILRDGYSFRCTCPLCKDVERDKRLLSYRCSCGGIQYPTITKGTSRPELWVCSTCGKEGYYADEYRIIEDEQCYSLLIWLQTDDGYSYKRTAELYREYKEKCTSDNFLFIRLLQFLLTYFIALKRSAETEEISQTLLEFALKYREKNSRAVCQEYVSSGKLDEGLGKHISATKKYKEALRIATITDGEDSKLAGIIKGLMSDVAPYRKGR